MRYSILLLPLALAACATTGSNGGVVAISTVTKGQDLPGAQCHVSTAAGNWDVITPGSVQIGGAAGDLRVVCNKPGYRTSEVVYKPSSGYGSSLGIGAGGGGGNVGVGVGLSIPVRMGSGGYPADITVTMNPQ